MIRLLETKYPIKRAQMRLRIVIPSSAEKILREQLQKLTAAVEREDFLGDTYSTVCVVPCTIWRLVLISAVIVSLSVTCE